MSCTAVIYLLREDLSRSSQPHRPHYSRRRTPFSWIRDRFSPITGSSGSRERPDASRIDKTRIGPQQGWMHARSTSDWDLDTSGAGLNSRHDSPPLMRTAERRSSESPVSSNSASPRSSHYYAPTSDSNMSVGRVDVHSLRGGRFYTESHQGITIESQLALPATRHLDSQTMTSSDSFTKFSSHASTENTSIPNPFIESSPPSIRGFNTSGSKFIEAL